jgi:tetratricopeptide (TPR) repeat protein
LVSVLDRQELESVLAHEIGHVKKYHLILYVLLFLGFSLLAGALVEPLPFLLLGSDWFYRLLGRLQVSPDDLLVSLTAVSLLILMVLYFRFLFGYFIRNFERQADLFVFRAQGTSRPLIRSFEKIASLSGNIREKKSWHHFGIGQRIDFLEKCERDQGYIKRHNRKVYVSLAVYFLLVGCIILSMNSVDADRLVKENELRYAQAVLEQKLKEEPDNSLWLQLLGDLMQENKMEKKAVDAYEKALKISPMKPDLANNMAWLLLTAKDKSLRDPVRALTLARLASTLEERGHILDTLATALWANGLVDEAIRTEIRAIRMDPDHEEFYQAQIEKFRAEAWEDS